MCVCVCLFHLLISFPEGSVIAGIPADKRKAKIRNWSCLSWLCKLWLQTSKTFLNKSMHIDALSALKISLM